MIKQEKVRDGKRKKADRQIKTDTIEKSRKRDKERREICTQRGMRGFL